MFEELAEVNAIGSQREYALEVAESGLLLFVVNDYAQLVLGQLDSSF